MQAHHRTSQDVSCSPRCAAPTLVRQARFRRQGNANPWTSHALCICAAASLDQLPDVGGLDDTFTGQQPATVGTPFKYKRLPCSSPCRADDVRCHQVEALFQHVLNYPRIPTRVCQWLPSITTDMATITHTVEGLTRKFGQELTTLFLRRSPHLLVHDLDTLTARAEHVRSMLDLKPSEIFMVLRKNPVVFTIEPQTLRQRYNALHKVLPLSHEAIKAMVRKYPLILNYQTSTVEDIMDSLRQVSYTRLQWAEDFDNMTPSTLAFFFRDSNDLMDRLEYLVATGSAPFVRLKEVFKMTNNVFARRNRGFDAWMQERTMIAQRRQMMMQQQQAQRAQQAAVLAQLRGETAAAPAQTAGPQGQQGPQGIKHGNAPDSRRKAPVNW